MATYFFLGLGAAILVAAVAWETWVRYVRRRCRACGRAWALRRIPGTRRDGFVRLRCKYCGTKQRGVIEPKDDGGLRYPPP